MWTKNSYKLIISLDDGRNDDTKGNLKWDTMFKEKTGFYSMVLN